MQEYETMRDILKTEDIVSVLKKILGTSLWTSDKKLSEFLKEPLLRACAWYLYKEKRRGYALNNVGTSYAFSSFYTQLIMKYRLNINTHLNETH